MTERHPEPDPHLGTIVADRYEIVERIGDGGVGVVYKALQKPIGRAVAVKVLQPDAMDERTTARFFKEAQIIANLRHPHTVRLYDFGRTARGEPFLVMEYLEGGTLRDLMREGRVRQIPALRIMRQVCRALEEAHAAGVVHRDLKPENVLFDRVRGEDFVVRVVDFGMAHTAEPPLEPESSGEWRGRIARDLTPPRTRLGTPGYMAPEQAFAKEIDGRADLYVVGVLLFEMMTGHPPFLADETPALHLAHLHDDAPEPGAIAPGIELDPAVEHLLRALLAKKPEHRPRSAASVVRKMDRVLARLNPPSDMSIEVNVADFIEPLEERLARPEAPPGSAEVDIEGQMRRQRWRMYLSVGGALVAVLAVWAWLIVRARA